jgi:hypothetical protein
MRIDSSGRVGVGTNSPAYVIDAAATSPRINVAAASTSFAGFRAANTSGNFQFVIDDSTGSSFLGTAYGRLIYSSGAYPLQFATNATERARITSDGALLVGATSVSSVGGVTLYSHQKQATVNGDTFSDQQASNMAFNTASGSNDSGASTCYLARYNTIFQGLSRYNNCN